MTRFDGGGGMFDFSIERHTGKPHILLKELRTLCAQQLTALLCLVVFVTLHNFVLNCQHSSFMPHGLHTLDIECKGVLSIGV